MNINIKKLFEDAIIPTKAHTTDAGFDMYVHRTEFQVSTKLNLHLYGKFIARTGVAIDIPEGYVGLLFPRSSIYKMDLRQSNSVGVIDAGYQGEISFIYDIKDNRVTSSYGTVGNVYKPGDRCGQLVIIPIPLITLNEVDSFDSVSERGTGGFGSTGK